jgi:hypothetical protein
MCPPETSAFVDAKADADTRAVIKPGKDASAHAGERPGLRRCRYPIKAALSRNGQAGIEV